MGRKAQAVGHKATRHEAQAMGLKRAGHQAQAMGHQATRHKPTGHKATVELVLDCAEPERLARFWREALEYRDYYTDAKLAVLVPKEGIASPLLLQGVPEPKAGKNRMHLDIVVDDVEAEVHRLQALGARRIDAGLQSFEATRWVRMSDPEQNEFCVSTGVEWEEAGDP
jgi:predicted enzyme related to lactoylglutathione lyase